jgi:hypothetical protein
MASKRQTYTIADRSKILATVKGWLTIELSDGKQVKARARDVRIASEGGITNRRIGNRRYDCSGYVRKVAGRLNVSAKGNATMDNGDELAKQLRGAELDDVYALASKALGETQTALKAKYGHLNVGMQRMNLGNRIRAASADSAE